MPGRGCGDLGGKTFNACGHLLTARNRMVCWESAVGRSTGEVHSDRAADQYQNSAEEGNLSLSYLILSTGISHEVVALKTFKE
ncbi:hypothetical protein NPIL_280721 [Nephila pilipes]|uniref:Uncharacterized protein n=1 Tax=Nephila pilipes TaxID=299642 RepID=A0A8X6MF20_NEPPI|nr:hypothetical protein NPIL_280721 [Nephila pilipes]